ncbi:hypothetical protein JCM10207_007239 [Rhodosporidiobolus poonsookiae]
MLHLDRARLFPASKARATTPGDRRRAYGALLRPVLVNQLAVLLPAMLLVQHLGLAFSARSSPAPTHSSSASPATSAAASPLALLPALPLLALGHDLTQYHTHRFLLHSAYPPLLRALNHAQHHSTGATRAVTACYMSPADFFLEIVLPYLLPLAAVTRLYRYGFGVELGGTPFHALVASAGAIGGLYEHSGHDLAPLLCPSYASSYPFLRPQFTSPSRASSVRAPPKPQPGTVRRLLAALLDNRAHAAHHVRGSVSFSDGFGSTGVADWAGGTRRDLVA